MLSPGWRVKEHNINEHSILAGSVVLKVCSIAWRRKTDSARTRSQHDSTYCGTQYISATSDDPRIICWLSCPLLEWRCIRRVFCQISLITDWLMLFNINVTWTTRQPKQIPSTKDIHLARIPLLYIRSHPYSTCWFWWLREGCTGERNEIANAFIIPWSIGKSRLIRHFVFGKLFHVDLLALYKENCTVFCFITYVRGSYA